MKNLSDIKARLKAASEGERVFVANGVLVDGNRVMSINQTTHTTGGNTVVHNVSLDIEASERDFYRHAHEDIKCLIEHIEEPKASTAANKNEAKPAQPQKRKEGKRSS